MSMKCPGCGTELPDGASFCLRCGRSLIERREIKPPRLWRKKAALLLGAALILAAAAAAVLLLRGPRAYEGGAFVDYTDADGSYRLIVCFFPGDVSSNRPIRTKTVTASGEDDMDTPMLGIFRDGELADTEEFFRKVESCTMEAVPAGEGTIICDEPEYSEDFHPAARECSIHYTSESGTNDLVWTIRMKNGDVIRLRQTYIVEPTVRQVYTAEDTPLDTLDELTALIDRVAAETDPDTVVDIYLPAVRYEGELTLSTRAVNLHGCGDGSGRTVFTGTLTVMSDSPSNVMLYDLDFEGSGGTGLRAMASVWMSGCSFTGWDIGAAALDGGMIAVGSCVFRNNGIGFRYSSAEHSSFSETFSDCTLENNGIGVQFRTLKGTIRIDFAGSRFSGNGTDIDNPIDYPIETSGAIFG